MAIPEIEKPNYNNKLLMKRRAPNIDRVLHACSVQAADELALLNRKDNLSNQEVIKMKELIQILLNVKKNSKPIRSKEKEMPELNDIFGDEE